MVSVIPEGY